MTSKALVERLSHGRESMYPTSITILVLSTNTIRHDNPKPVRNFSCESSTCNIKPFGSKADLLRHQREVHRRDEDGRSLDFYPCPVHLCKRNTRGFARQWNLNEHCRRVHGLPSASPPREDPETTDSDSLSVSHWIRGLSTSPPNPMDVASWETLPLMKLGRSPSLICRDLRAELFSLQSHREDLLRIFNAGISSLEKAIEALEKEEQ